MFVELLNYKFRKRPLVLSKKFGVKAACFPKVYALILIFGATLCSKVGNGF